MPGCLSVRSLFLALVMFSNGLAFIGVGRPELAELLGICNSIGVLLFCLPLGCGRWCLRAIGRRGERVKSITFCIITSLAYGDVNVLPKLVILVCGPPPFGAGVRSGVRGPCGMGVVLQSPPLVE